MWHILIPVVGTVLVAVIAAGAQVINSRNDRAQAHQEIDLLRKLDPTSDTARELAEVVQARIGRWHQKFYKNTPKLEGSRRLQPDFVIPDYVVPLVAVGAILALVLGMFVGYFAIVR